MKKITFYLFLGVIVVLNCINTTFAQENRQGKPFGSKYLDLLNPGQDGTIKCATTFYESALGDRNSQARRQAFEQWIAPKVAEKKNAALLRMDETEEEIIRIPVVVHVIHRNRNYGQNENIRDEQILSQIEVLNQDYRRMEGTNGFNTNPVGADIKVEFCLAQRTPEGDPTDGINRVSMIPQGGFWWMNEIDERVKPATIWNPDEYLNIWIVDEMSLFGIFEILGYAYFPDFDGIPGLEADARSSRNIDGVVIGHRYFGSAQIFPGGTYANSNVIGRTATHEVGHWMGLRHIWGDSSSCDVDDFCEDTPPATAQNETCSPNESCGGFNMIENYMDYTPETCQNIFTQDQKARMRAVMENATRRSSLRFSEGCTPPEVHEFDAGLRINGIEFEECSNNGVVNYKVINAGLVDISSIELSWTNSVISGEVSINESILAGEERELTLVLNQHDAINNTFQISIESVNGQMDDYLGNNSRVMGYSTPNFIPTTIHTITVEVTSDDYGDESSWSFVNVTTGEVLYERVEMGDNEVDSQVFELEEGNCYQFVMLDAYSDGICCGYGDGGIVITNAVNEVLFTGGQFSSEIQVMISAISEMSVNDIDEKLISIYPNPTNSILTIDLNDLDMPSEIQVYSILGQKMFTRSVTSSEDLILDVNGYSSGVYLIQMKINDQIVVKRFVVK